MGRILISKYLGTREKFHMESTTVSWFSHFDRRRSLTAADRYGNLGCENGASINPLLYILAQIHLLSPKKFERTFLDLLPAEASVMNQRARTVAGKILASNFEKICRMTHP